MSSVANLNGGLRVKVTVFFILWFAQEAFRIEGLGLCPIYANIENKESHSCIHLSFAEFVQN